MPQNPNERTAVRNLQTYLRQLSYHNPEISAPPVDGIFDSATETSLKDFQKVYGLPVTGSANQYVWELLYALYRASRAEHTGPQRMEVFPPLPPDDTIGPGASGFPVAAVQFMLRELETQYGGLLDTKLTGSFDEDTARAVREFQQQNRLPQTGAVNRTTWNALADQYNTLYTRFPKQ